MNVHFVTFFGKSISASVVGIHNMVTKAELCASTVRNSKLRVFYRYVFFFIIGGDFVVEDDQNRSTLYILEPVTESSKVSTAEYNGGAMRAYR